MAIRLIQKLTMVRVIIKFKRYNFSSSLQLSDIPQCLLSSLGNNRPGLKSMLAYKHSSLLVYDNDYSLIVNIYFYETFSTLTPTFSTYTQTL
jgi:hypothetical protein